MQSDHIAFANYTFLKKGEKTGTGSRFMRWVPGKGAKMALYPNMNHKDPAVATALFQDARGSAMRSQCQSTGNRSTR